MAIAIVDEGRANGDGLLVGDGSGVVENIVEENTVSLKSANVPTSTVDLL